MVFLQTNSPALRAARQAINLKTPDLLIARWPLLQLVAANALLFGLRHFLGFRLAPFLAACFALHQKGGFS